MRIKLVRAWQLLVGCAVILLLTLSGCSKPPAPPTPGGVTAEVVSSTEVLLKWSPIGPDAKYEISRKEGASGTYQVLGMMEPQSASLLHTPLRSGTTYYFRIRACNAGGCSPYSEVSATTPSG